MLFLAIVSTFTNNLNMEIQFFTAHLVNVFKTENNITRKQVSQSKFTLFFVRQKSKQITLGSLPVWNIILATLKTRQDMETKTRTKDSWPKYKFGISEGR